MFSSSSSATFPSHLPQTFSSLSKSRKFFSSLSFKKQATTPFICLKIGVEELAELAHNKALVAAAVSSAIGQFSKPFTSALCGTGVDFKATFRSGGMPSTHSAGVVAAATSLGLERGFSDSIFGMSVVFAAIVMYDAQGVRKEVGYHAKILNRILLKTRESETPYREDDDLIESNQRTSSLTSESLTPLLSLSEKGSSYRPDPMPPCTPNRSESNRSRASTKSNSLVDGEDMFRNAISISAVDREELLRKAYGSYFPLKEYVGHTEIEVLVGALLGFIVSLAIDLIL
ncbi:hypothetical protein MRB53_016560 [Persea americana]|uniref:Uncharacterized protein n=1 Tax=Persea americana TaxID=3435 RepID=A0ACC2M259_PERAE|nr:hypothetical protein MRB53_016560 [Persea americana]|eukprot:TRINITY_DN7772_c0_g1_i1.p1 TRINITY_DN7772_c0_g1~~TRINITY_DN7772_c0_g1_i1.p1  ORF type:complete len:287 (+),score=59.41 TRINITY_DN7772_c0_g1_i1:294-1154(+)